MKEHPIPLGLAAEHYLTTCQVEGKTFNTLMGYSENLGRFVRCLDGKLGDPAVDSVRRYIAHTEGAHPGLARGMRLHSYRLNGAPTPY